MLKYVVGLLSVAILILGAMLVFAMISPGHGTISNSIGMNLVFIKPGTFMMGSPVDEIGREDGETQHSVTLTRGFFMGTTEVTQAQWQAVMDTTLHQQRDKANPQRGLAGEGGNFPMYYVSWDEAVEFCRKLSQMEGKKYRLPTQAEWEYACRAGTTTAFSTGATITTSQANYNGYYPYGNAPVGMYRETTTPAGSLAANPWGLYDMHGNVCEWCADWFADYPRGDATDPEGPTIGALRIARGGSWVNEGQHLRSSGRGRSLPINREFIIGFRVVLDL